MMLPLTQEKITTGYFSKLIIIRSFRYNLICRYEFKSSYKSCGYSSTHGTRRYNSIAKNGCEFEKITHTTGFDSGNLWLFECFANRQRPKYIMVKHISHTRLIIIFSLRRKATLNPYSISRVEFRAARSTHKVCLDNLLTYYYILIKKEGNTQPVLHIKGGVQSGKVHS